MKPTPIFVHHLILAGVLGVIIYAVLKPFPAIPGQALIIDSAISGSLLSAFLLLFRYIGIYSVSLMPQNQILINGIGISLTFTLCESAMKYLLLYLVLPEGDFASFIPFAFIRGIMTLLFFLCMVFLYIYRFMSSKLEEYSEEKVIEEEAIQQNIHSPEWITVKNNQKIEVIQPEEIIMVKAEGDYVMIYSSKGKFLKEQTMKSLESMLPAEKFVRVHRSAIVNVCHIAQIELYDKQTRILKLQNGERVKVSRNGYSTLKSLLGL